MQRIGIAISGGCVAGLNTIVAGAVLAASKRGWSVVGIRDGFDGLLFPDKYERGGTLELGPRTIEDCTDAGCILGTGARTDPFRVREIVDGSVEELDRSDELVGKIRDLGIDAMVLIAGGSSISGAHSLSVALKLHRKGLPIVCVPKSAENDIPGAPLAFGYNSALSYAVDALERIRLGALESGRVAVAEVLGQHAGWLALQSAIAVRADAVLLPEVPYDLRVVAAALGARQGEGRAPALVVVAEGASPVHRESLALAAARTSVSEWRRSLAPNSDVAFGEDIAVIERSGLVGSAVALELQRLSDCQTIPFVLGQLVRGGVPTALDRQLGLGYGAGAVRAVESGATGTMIVFSPPSLMSKPLRDVVNAFRTVPRDSELIRVANDLGVTLGAPS